MSLDDLQHEIESHAAAGKRVAVADDLRRRSNARFAAWCVSISLHCLIALALSVVVLGNRHVRRDPPRIMLAYGEQAVVPSVRLPTPAQLAALEQLPSPTDPPPITKVEPIQTDPPAAASAAPPLDAAALPESALPKPDLSASRRSGSQAAGDSSPPAPTVVVDAADLAPPAPPVDVTEPRPLKLAVKPMPPEPADPTSTPALPEAGGDSSPPVGIKRGVAIADLPTPRYPTQSVRLGHEGVVVIEVRVGPDGSVLDTRILEDPGHPALVQAALDAVRRARFDPALIDGHPVPSRIEIPFAFQLDDRR